jgi:hypothetical protein
VAVAGDKLQQDIRNWLSPPDPWKNHNSARESRHEGTGMWFVRGSALSEWKASGPSSLLWIHGKRQLLNTRTLLRKLMTYSFVAGAGKSVLWYANSLILGT